MFPSRSTLTRLSGRGRSSVESQKSIACLAMRSSVHSGASFVSPGCSPRNIGGRRLADHLDVPERVVEVVGAEVEVVQPERLLVGGRVLLAREGEHGGRVVEHVVAADLIRAVRETIRVLVVRGEEQDLRRVGRAADSDDHVGRVALLRPVVLDHDLGDRGARVVGVEPDHLPVRQQGDVGVLERRTHAEHLGVRLRVDEAGEAVARGTTNARAERWVGLVEHDPARRVERVVAGGLELVGELLDPWLVRHGGMRVGGARRRFGRVLAARAVHLVVLLRERVVRLELVVGHRPGG